MEGLFHPRIEHARDEYFTRKKEEQRNLCDKALKYFENAWVWEKEKELRQLQEQEETATDLDVKRTLHYIIGVTVEALKLNFKRDELPGLARLVIMKRRKRALKMKWISWDQAERVKSVWAPMSYPFLTQKMIFLSHLQHRHLIRANHFHVFRNVIQGNLHRRQKHCTRVPKKGRITNFFQSGQQ